jgi:hypothetical protein
MSSNGPKKFTDLPVANTRLSTDRLVILSNAASTAVLKTISVANLGTVGYTGSIGYGGSVGATGYTGSLGYTGSVGATGYAGSVGATGYGGSVGATGYTGSLGYTGSVGTANASAQYTWSNTQTFSNTITLSANAGISLGSSSKAANGYTYLPNGVLMQWGTVVANNSTGNATFSVAFPTACQHVSMNVIGSANVAYHAAAPNTTVATIRTGSTTTAISVEYLAIGY